MNFFLPTLLSFPCLPSPPFPPGLVFLAREKRCPVSIEKWITHGLLPTPACPGEGRWLCRDLEETQRVSGEPAAQPAAQPAGGTDSALGKHFLLAGRYEEGTEIPVYLMIYYSPRLFSSFFLSFFFFLFLYLIFFPFYIFLVL